MKSKTMSDIVEQFGRSERVYPRPDKVIHYEKLAYGGIVRCSVEVFGDDSAHVDGDEIEIIFERASDSAENAMAHIESLGYVRSP